LANFGHSEFHGVKIPIFWGETLSYDESIEKRHKEALMRKTKKKLVEIIVQLENEVESLGGALDQVDYD